MERAWLIMASAALGWRGMALAAVLVGVHGRRGRTRRAGVAEESVDHLAALLMIGLSASLTLNRALEAAAREIGGPLLGEVEDLLRRARTRGTAGALAETEGALAELATQLAQAQLTGAPMVGAVSTFLATRRSSARGRLLERARTLPVRLIVPVALLLLPGFVLLVMGPFVVDQISDLVGAGL